MKKHLFTICFLVYASSFFAQGNGSSGSRTVTGTSYTDSIRTTISATSNSGQTVVTVGSSTGIVAGNLVLLIQSQGASAGLYEVGTVASVTATTLTFTSNLTNTYTAGGANRAQAIRVNQYSNVTINSGGVLTCNAWNGNTGGVCYFYANGTVTINAGGKIDVTNKGYLGGSGGAGGAGGSGAPGWQVGSLFGDNCDTPPCQFCVPGQGSGNCVFSGCGGVGGNLGGRGGDGSFNFAAATIGTPGNPGITGSGPGGAAYNATAINASDPCNWTDITYGASLLMGGGGGGAPGSTGAYGGNGGGAGGVGEASGGTGGNGGTTGGAGATGGDGGNGGGIIVMYAKNLTGAGTISTNGSTATPGNNGNCGGIGGSGGNGGDGMSDCNDPTQRAGGGGGGGTGGAGSDASAGGGGGAGGAVWIAVVGTNSFSGTTIAGGAAGASGGLSGGCGGAGGAGGSAGNCGGCGAQPGGNAPAGAPGNGPGATGKAGGGTPKILTTTTSGGNSVTIQSSNSSICSGGIATLTATGASTYTWNPGGITGATVNVSPSNTTTYTVTASISTGCSATATLAVNVSKPPVITSVPVNPTCSTSNGSVTINVTSGTAAYTYLWTTSASSTTSNSSMTITNLPAGNYGVTVTDATGCSTTQANTISTTPAVASAASGVSATCGFNNGVITVSPSGGNGIFTYAWSGGATAQTVANLAPGSYTVTVTDGNNCTSTSTTSIVNIPGVVAGIQSSTDVSCNGGLNGIAIASTTGGTPGFTFNWSPGGATTQTAGGLGANTYTVTITDGNSCTSTAVSTITEPTVLVATPSSTNSTCGNSNGQVTVAVSGGVTNYSYSWSNGFTTASQSGLAAGPYDVTITDANGCVVSTAFVLSNTSGPGASISASTNIKCNGDATGNATALASGGTTGYTYGWSSGGSGSVESGLKADTYTVTISDANACTATSTVLITEPTILSSSISTTSSTCNTANGSASINVSGGVSPYQYNWNNGNPGSTNSTLPAGIYTVTVTDANGCLLISTATVQDLASPSVALSTSKNVTCYNGNDGNASVAVSGGTAPLTYTWSNGLTGVTTASGLNAGPYTISVIDANGCVNQTSFAISQPQPYVVNINAVQETCTASNGTASALVSGGTGPYSYIWSNGNTTSTITGVGAGIYNVTITDASSCPLTTSITLTDAPTGVLDIASKINVDCNGSSSGKAVATVTGGTGTITYIWSNGTTTNNATNLLAGTYSVTISDANGCATSTEVIITEPAPLAGTFSNVPAACSINNGVSIVAASGGIGTYSYIWSNGTPGPTATGLATGSYSVTVTDANGCTLITTTSLTNTDPVDLTLAGAQTICIGQSAVISGTASNGTPSYTYSWSNNFSGGAAPQTVSPIVTTSYTLSVTDANGCTNVQSVQVDVNKPIDVTLASNPTNVCLGSSITLTATASGGNGNYTYSWQPGGIGNPIVVSPSSDTIYQVTVTDDCGSPVSVTSINIKVNTLPTVSILSDKASGCGAPLCINFSGTTSATCVQSIWDFGDNKSSSATNPSHCYTSTGQFSVSLTCIDSNGCSTTRNVANMIDVFERPKAGFSYSPDPLVKSDSILLVDFNNQSVGSVSWYWNFGDSSSASGFNVQHAYKDTGIYCVKLTAYSVNGCVDSTVKCLNIIDHCTIPKDIPNVFSPNADGVNDLFLIKNTGLTSLTCSVFNRWGMEIYEYNALRSGWDGRTFSDNAAPAGTYYYLLKATCILGNKLEGKGFVQLMR